MYQKFQGKKIRLFVIFLSSVAANLMAGSIVNYSLGDVMLCFRPAAGGAYDMVVDAGPVATLTNATPNQRITITGYTGNQLALVGTNLVAWSAFAWFDTSVSGNLQDTLFITRTRSLNTASQPQPAASASSQDLVVSDMYNITRGAASARNYNGVSSDYAVIEPDDPNNNNSVYADGLSYIGQLGPDLNFTGDSSFVNIESTTSSGFNANNAAIRSDFYQVPPTGQGAVKRLGYFEFNTNGAMTYVAYPTAPTVATVAASSITSTGGQLNSSVTVINPSTDITSYFFQYGLSTSYGSSSPSTSIGASGSYSSSISGLTAGTLYHFRAAAYNQYGTNYGNDLTFSTTAGSNPSVPVIQSISRSNNVATITFTTGGTGIYTLRGTNSLTSGTAKTNWPALSSTAGTGSIISLKDTNNSATMFYIISAQ